MTPRLEATHFIEQYNGQILKQNFTPAMELSCLEDTLSYTKEKTCFNTVAVFKIKFKDGKINSLAGISNVPTLQLQEA